MNDFTRSLPRGSRTLNATRAWRCAVTIVVLAALFGGAAAAAVGPDYRIGIDDVLVISVWDQKDLDQVVSVRPDGKISLPLVGETEAGGLTVSELSNKLTTLYSRTVRGAQVNGSVRELRSRT